MSALILPRVNLALLEDLEGGGWGTLPLAPYPNKTAAIHLFPFSFILKVTIVT
jgi:hypothetical protein